MTAVRWWLRNLAVGAAVGFTVGVVLGGTLGRIFMRVLFLAKEDALGLETAMGAIVGEFTVNGTAAIYAFGAIAGVALGVSYAVSRTLLPAGTFVRTLIFTSGTTAFMLGQIVRGNRDDFSFLPVTLGLFLAAAAVALTALPVPMLVERLAPDRPRTPGRVARSVVVLGMTGFAVFGASGIVTAYAG